MINDPLVLVYLIGSFFTFLYYFRECDIVELTGITLLWFIVIPLVLISKLIYICRVHFLKWWECECEGSTDRERRKAS